MVSNGGVELFILLKFRTTSHHADFNSSTFLRDERHNRLESKDI